MDNHTFMENWFQRVWVNEDLSTIDEMIAPEVTIRGLTEAPQMSQDDLRSFCGALLGLCDFSAVDIEHFLEDGTWTQMLVTFRGTARGTDKPLAFSAQIMVRVVDGRIAEAYNHPDFIAMFQQLGLLPGDLLARLLRGESVG